MRFDDSNSYIIIYLVDSIIR